MLPAPLEESASTARSLKARGRIGIGVLGVLLAVGVASCGGSRQDANEPEGNFPVSIVSADFPSKQQLAENTNLTLSVENSGNQTIPDLAITIFTSSNASTTESTSTGTTSTGTTSTSTDLPTSQGSFSVRSEQPGLAIPFRPVWILEAGYPKLAGQYPDYLAKALRDYKSGARKNPIMAGMVASLTPVDIDNVAAYYAGLPPVVRNTRK
jgi:hypothetical protein